MYAGTNPTKLLADFQTKILILRFFYSLKQNRQKNQKIQFVITYIVIG